MNPKRAPTLLWPWFFFCLPPLLTPRDWLPTPKIQFLPTQGVDYLPPKSNYYLPHGLITYPQKWKKHKNVIFIIFFSKKWWHLKNIFHVYIFHPYHQNFDPIQIHDFFRFFVKMLFCLNLAKIAVHRIGTIIDKSLCDIEKIKLGSERSNSMNTFSYLHHSDQINS